MNEEAILVVQEYMLDLFVPGRNWPEYELQKRSYERWAAKEILECLKSEPNRHPIVVVREFARKTRKYAEMDHNDKNDRIIFEVANNVAMDILDILRAMS